MKCPNCKIEITINQKDCLKVGFLHRIFDCTNCAIKLGNPVKGECIRRVAFLFLISGILSFGGRWSMPEPTPTLFILTGIGLLILAAKQMAYAVVYKKTH
jgi:hypothetical protein